MKCILIQLKKNYPACYLLYSVCMKYCMHGIPNCVKYPRNAADLLCDCHPWESHTGAEPTAPPSSPCWWSSGSSSYAVLGRVCFTDNGQCCRGLESVLLRRLGVLGCPWCGAACLHLVLPWRLLPVHRREFEELNYLNRAQGVRPLQVRARWRCPLDCAWLF